ncbi:hypothetical protein PENSPDRAFT_414019 [Peniophora sp. CONT]|nr:hypothetical protein PENSPDRAFT_414019 [Peniophora sp. CONT]
MSLKPPEPGSAPRTTKGDTENVLSPSSHRARRRLFHRFILSCLACVASLLVWTTHRHLHLPAISSPPRVTEHASAPSPEPAVYHSHTTDIDWQPAILTEHGAVVELPERGVCLGADSAWMNVPSGAVPVANTSLESHAFHAKGRINLRKGVRTVYVDTGVRTMGLDAQLHIVSGAVDHAVLDVEAFYDKAGALSPIYACAYQPDWTREAWLKSLPNPDDMEVYYETEEEEELLSYEELIALRVSQIPTEPDAGELQDIDLFRLQRSNVNSMGTEAPVWFNTTLTIPVEDKSYKVKVDVGGIFDVKVHGDVELESLKVLGLGGSIDQAPSARGRVVAEVRCPSLLRYRTRQLNAF